MVASVLFKKVPKETTFEDLTLQQPPTEEPMEIEAGNLEEGGQDLPQPFRKFVVKVGWQVDDVGNPLIVSRRAWAFRTPESKYEVRKYPHRTTWARYGGEWVCLEREVKWYEQDNPNAYLPRTPAEMLITSFQARTKSEDVPLSIKKHKASHQVNTVSYFV